MTVPAHPVAEPWLVVEEGFDPARQRATETRLTIGNGRFSTRGSLEEGYPGDLAATLMHGVFAPQPIVVSELANLPDWTALEVAVDGERFSMARGTVLDHRRVLDLRSGLLRREVTWRSPTGVTIGLVFERFASLVQPDVAAVRVTVTAIDTAATVEVRATLPATATNDGSIHLVWDAQHVGDSSASLAVHLRDTDTAIALAARLEARGLPVEREGWDVRGYPTTVVRWKTQPGERAVFEKVVVLASSREAADPAGEAAERLEALAGEDFDRLHAASASAWERDWAISDVIIDGDPDAQLATRFSIYHLLIAAPRGDEQVSIGAKTLSGFGYRGHVFWDMETFMLPFFTHVHPAIARDLLSYRYHRLPGARRKAARGGFEGAQVPWESADTGDEVTPRWVPNVADPGQPMRIWTGDIEIHISAVVAHAVMDYWHATADDHFMLERGAEIVLETARFWASRAEWDPTAARFEFSDVIGPDEYHEHVDNNAFTNYLAAWHLQAAAELIEWLVTADPEQASGLGATPDLAARFAAVADGIYLPKDVSTGLIEQFSGYFSREDVDLAAYNGRTSSMQAILGLKGVNRTQVLKQPDVLMLAYLMPELLTPTALATNYAYYNARTDHAYGSSLGPAIQALLAVRLGEIDEGYAHFVRAAGADLRDVRGNSADGIHGASAGGIWQALVFGFGGVHLDGEELVAEPRLPSSWNRLAFHLVHRGRVVAFDLRRPGEPASPPARVRGLIFDLDGVITDTAELHYRAWQRLADEEGFAFDRRANDALRGISRRESLRLVLGGRHVSEARANELMDRKNAYYLEFLKTLTPRDVLPGSIEFIDAARQRGLSIALASASKNAREVLDRLAIADHFDVICDGYTPGAPKPAPDLFLAAASGIGLPPDACVVFEDAAEGIAAAHAAGMAAVGIGPAERVGAAEIIVPGLAAANLDAILAIRREVIVAHQG
jgi:beta-phosphoglucomutase